MYRCDKEVYDALLYVLSNIAAQLSKEEYIYIYLYIYIYIYETLVVFNFFFFCTFNIIHPSLDALTGQPQYKLDPNLYFDGGKQNPRTQTFLAETHSEIQDTTTII